MAGKMPTAENKLQFLKGLKMEYAFPSPDGIYDGMTLRDWFATHAPAPTENQIKNQMEYDVARNPHNEYRNCLPARRSRSEIIADFAYEYADSMMKARNKETR